MNRGLRTAVRTLVGEYRNQRNHANGVRAASRYSGKAGLKLQFGCGTNTKAGWVNIDLSSKSADLTLDAREEFPFGDDSCAMICSEHFFEHLEYPGEVLLFLKDSHRVLAPGGTFSVGVPDAGACLVAYAKGDAEAFRVDRELYHPDWCDTWMHQVNYQFRQGKEHKYAYDFETLEKMLSTAGLVKIERRSWDPELDSQSWKYSGTLYVTGKKPAN
jgi:predicted SAM-dependent methyltransferase